MDSRRKRLIVRCNRRDRWKVGDEILNQSLVLFELSIDPLDLLIPNLLPPFVLSLAMLGKSN